MQKLELRKWPIKGGSIFAAFIFVFLFGCSRQKPGTESSPLLVFAAASLTDVLEPIAELYESKTGQPVSFNLAGTGTLARQIQAGVQADLFLSANERWMDEVETAGRVDAGTRIWWLSNELMVVGNRRGEVSIQEPGDWMDEAIGFVAVGDPSYVPAGKYAETWLQSMVIQREGENIDVWSELKSRNQLTFASDVRGALRQVMASRTAVGVVYRTDYLAFRDQLKLLLEMPDNLDCTARYSAAVLSSSQRPGKARDFLEFLQGNEASAILKQAGFSVSSH